MTVAERVSNCTAYDTLAEHYDRLTANHDYGLWVGEIERCLRRQGVTGDALLDVGCGTGHSTGAWCDAGYRVVGVDVSAGMLARARAKLPGVRFHRADLRTLPDVGTFDVVSCLCDVVNCVPAEDLDTAFAAIAARLAPGGLLVFDANTLHAYRTYFSVTEVVVDDLVWRGGADASFAPGDSASLTIASSQTTSTQRQHHHPPDVLQDALAGAGLTVVDRYGQGFDALPERPLDEERHTKAVYIARRSAPREERR